MLHVKVGELILVLSSKSVGTTSLLNCHAASHNDGQEGNLLNQTCVWLLLSGVCMCAYMLACVSPPKAINN